MFGAGVLMLGGGADHGDGAARERAASLGETLPGGVQAALAGYTPPVARQKLDKTNAMRLLDQRRVPYEALAYDPAIHSAVGVAEVLGVPPERVYKTLVALHEAPGRRPLLVMIAGPEELDLRLLARSVESKAVRMAPQREAERLTGLLVGGIGALALVGKPFEPCIERAALDHDWVLVNGGRRGLNLKLAVSDLIALTGARVVDAVRRDAPADSSSEGA
jgi:Cys-tRNA(Pro)/Cys-tRNA(Cys) deacylase